MQRVLAALILVFFLAIPALAQFASRAYVSNFAILSASTEIDFHGRYRSLQIWSDPGSADLYVELNDNTATVNGATCIHITPGGSWSSPPGVELGVQKIKYIGSAASGRATLVAVH